MSDQPHYPYADGEVAVLGPDVRATGDGMTITWQGARYRRDYGDDALQRYRAWLAAEHAKAVRADQAGDCPPELRISPHNGLAAGLDIALFGLDQLLVGHGHDVGRSR